MDRSGHREARLGRKRSRSLGPDAHPAGGSADRIRSRGVGSGRQRPVPASGRPRVPDAEVVESRDIPRGPGSEGGCDARSRGCRRSACRPRAGRRRSAGRRGTGGASACRAAAGTPAPPLRRHDRRQSRLPTGCSRPGSNFRQRPELDCMSGISRPSRPPEHLIVVVHGTFSSLAEIADARALFSASGQGDLIMTGLLTRLPGGAAPPCPGRARPDTRPRGRRRVSANRPPPRTAGPPFARTVRFGRL